MYIMHYIYIIYILYIMYIYIICIYVYIHTNLPVDVTVRLPHPPSGDSQGQEMFLAPSADKRTRNHVTCIYI